MSDDFDKEAEREKLREKFADDEEEREHTQRMSELLLQGATMTNRHCDDCGDPIFRKDGREFCPTCHTVGAADAQDAENSARATDGSAGAAGGSTATPAGGDPPAAGANGTVGTGQGDGEPAGTTPEPSAGTPEPQTETPESPTRTPSPAAARPGRPTGAAEDSAATASTAGSGSVADARASLARTLNRFAAAAEETDDPRRARDHLQAAREAAEALAALDR